MMDVRGQYARIQEEVDAAVLDVVRSGQFINGPAVKSFTANLADWLGPHEMRPQFMSIPCANGTDALQPPSWPLESVPETKSSPPRPSFISTVEILHLLRITPVMVDVDPAFTLDPAAAVAKAITPKTKAILPVHLYGQCADMTALRALAAQRKLALVEDTARAIEIFLGDLPTRALGASGHDGHHWHHQLFHFQEPPRCLWRWGACFTRDAALAEQLRMICNHGSRRRYEHEIIGMNSRLDSIQAAFWTSNFPHLNGYNAARQGPQTATMPCSGTPAHRNALPTSQIAPRLPTNTP